MINNITLEHTFIFDLDNFFELLINVLCLTWKGINLCVLSATFKYVQFVFEMIMSQQRKKFTSFIRCPNFATRKQVLKAFFLPTFVM